MSPKNQEGQFLKTEADVWEILAGRLKKPPRSDIWKTLVITEFVGNVLYSVQEISLHKGDLPFEETLEEDLETSIKTLVGKYDELERQVFSTGAVPEEFEEESYYEEEKSCVHSEKVHGPGDYYGLLQRSLSKILAISATRRPEVQKFRQEVLGGKLLNPEEVQTWIEQKAGESVAEQVKKHPEINERVQFLSGDSKAERQAKLARFNYLRKLEELYFDMIEYAVPHSGWVHCTWIGKTGEIGRLKQLASRLAKSYSWQEAQAVAFILTEKTPLYPTIRITHKISTSSPARITLDIWARLPVEMVAEVYRKARRQLIKGRDRKITKKHLELAIFAAENTRGTWAEKMRRWNNTYPGWEYEDWRPFARDCKAALNRVVSTGIILPESLLDHESKKEAQNERIG